MTASLNPLQVNAASLRYGLQLFTDPLPNLAAVNGDVIIRCDAKANTARSHTYNLDHDLVASDIDHDLLVHLP
jgi:hypothetical protein